jgi:hypothetical protein
MKTKLTLFITTLASLLFFGGCSSINPNYDNPIIAAFETKKHKEERLAKEKEEAEERAREAKKRQAEYEARRKREEKTKNDKLTAALRDPEISKWRSDLPASFSVSYGIAEQYMRKAENTNASDFKLSEMYMN